MTGGNDVGAAEGCAGSGGEQYGYEGPQFGYQWIEEPCEKCGGFHRAAAQPPARRAEDVLAEVRAQRDGNPGMAWNYRQDAQEDTAALAAAGLLDNGLRERVRALADGYDIRARNDSGRYVRAIDVRDDLRALLDADGGG